MAVRVVARSPITFAGLDGSTQHAPLAVASVAGIETRFVLDTGSEVHLLTRELVDRLGLATEPGEEGTDASGATLPSWSVEDCVLRLEDVELTLENVVAIPAPAPFHAWGVGGILSPQHLHSTAVAVVDTAADELLLLDGGDTEIAAWLSARAPGLTTLPLERHPSSSAVVVSASVRPYGAVPTLLDTGGRSTAFASAAIPGIDLGAAEHLGSGVSGASVTGSSAGARVLVVAGREVPVERLSVRAGAHDPPGVVGMDVLRGTVLACAADSSRPVLWQVSGG